MSEEFAARFPQTAQVIQQGIDRGLHFGTQVYVSLQGNVMADAGIGIAAPDVPMTADTISLWLSSGKPLTAVLIAQLQQAGQLDWNDPVAKFLPEFAAQGKESITLRHLLTHTAGLRHIDPGAPHCDWNESFRRICDASIEPGWIIGETAGYDPWNSWFILGEIIQRVTGEDFSKALADRVLRPCGMNQSWVNVTTDDYERLQPNLGIMWERKRGQLTPAEWHQSVYCTRPSPGSSFRGPIRELGRFYELLLSTLNGDDGGLLSRNTLEEMISRQREGQFDRTFLHAVDFGYGVIVDSNRYGAETVPYGYGRFCSPRTFGHGGSQSSQGYCDPEHGLVVAYVFNGRSGEPQHQRRVKALNDAIYRDLDLG